MNAYEHLVVVWMNPKLMSQCIPRGGANHGKPHALFLLCVGYANASLSRVEYVAMHYGPTKQGILSHDMDQWTVHTGKGRSSNNKYKPSWPWKPTETFSCVGKHVILHKVGVKRFILVKTHGNQKGQFHVQPPSTFGRGKLMVL